MPPDAAVLRVVRAWLKSFSPGAQKRYKTVCKWFFEYAHAAGDLSAHTRTKYGDGKEIDTAV